MRGDLAALDGTRFKEAFDRYLDEYGRRANGIELAFPLWLETPEFVLGLVSSYLTGRKGDPEVEHAALVPGPRRKRRDRSRPGCVAGDRGSAVHGVGCRGLAVVGLGVGVAGASLQTTAVEAAPHRLAGAAAGLFMTARYAGGIAAAGLTAGAVDSGAFRAAVAALLGAALLSLVSANGLAGARRHVEPEEVEVVYPEPPSAASNTVEAG
jgi:hypothetical protein